MLANNTSYEDSFTTCQSTPENYGSLLGSLLNMQLASRNPFSWQIFFAKFTGPPLQHALWLLPALSHNFRGTFANIYINMYIYIYIPIHRPRPSAGGALKEKRRPRALVFGPSKASLWLLLLAFSGALLLPDPKRQWVAALYIMIIISNFCETFAK